LVRADAGGGGVARAINEFTARVTKRHSTSLRFANSIPLQNKGSGQNRVNSQTTAPEDMNGNRDCFVTSPQGKTRAYCGVFLLGLPTILVFGWLLDPSAREWRVSGIIQVVSFCAIIALLVATFAAGIYYTVIAKVIILDLATGTVAQERRIWGRTVQCRSWRMCEFERIELCHRQYGEGPTNAHTTSVGIKHSTGFVIWLRDFWSSTNGPSMEALAFAAKLRAATDLPCDTDIPSASGN